MAMDYSMSGTATSSPGTEDIAKRIAQITSQNTPMMQQARTTGMQQANQRGLGNSSMAVGAAQAEAYRVAAPIAGQEADLNTRSREAQLGALVQLSGQRSDATATTLSNPDLPADARIAALRSYNDSFSQIANYLQSLYGSRLNQNAPGAPALPAPPVLPTAPPIMGAPGSFPGYGDFGYSQLRGLSFR